jgi:hypothetical protein
MCICNPGWFGADCSV